MKNSGCGNIILWYINGFFPLSVLFLVWAPPGQVSGHPTGGHPLELFNFDDYLFNFFFHFSALFLVEAGNEKLWLWQGWWPDVGHEANDTNMYTGLGIIRWHAE